MVSDSLKQHARTGLPPARLRLNFFFQGMKLPLGFKRNLGHLTTAFDDFATELLFGFLT